MPTVTFVRPNGERRTLDSPVGESVMAVAVANAVDEILAECGGSCVCATCHVYVDQAYLPRLPPAAAIEREMLAGMTAPARPDSRLSCQIRMTPALDGLVVYLPDISREAL